MIGLLAAMAFLAVVWPPGLLIVAFYALYLLRKETR